MIKTALDIGPPFLRPSPILHQQKHTVQCYLLPPESMLCRVLDHFFGEEASQQIDIVANDADISADGG